MAAAAFHSIDGGFYPYYGTGATSVTINGVPVTLPRILFRDPSCGLSVEPNGSPMSELNEVNGLVVLPGIGAPPRVVYFHPTSGLTDQPNGRPIAEVTESGGVLDIKCN